MLIDMRDMVRMKYGIWRSSLRSRALRRSDVCIASQGSSDPPTQYPILTLAIFLRWGGLLLFRCLLQQLDFFIAWSSRCLLPRGGRLEMVVIPLFILGLRRRIRRRDWTHGAGARQCVPRGLRWALLAILGVVASRCGAGELLCGGSEVAIFEPIARAFCLCS